MAYYLIVILKIRPEKCETELAGMFARNYSTLISHVSIKQEVHKGMPEHWMNCEHVASLYLSKTRWQIFAEFMQVHTIFCYLCRVLIP